jgi:porin
MKYPISLIFAALLAIVILPESQAGATEEVKKYSGSPGARDVLTGDWGGARNDLAEKGVTLDFTFTQVAQGLTSGGKDTGWEYGGRGDLVASLDTRKLGLWPGGVFSVEVEGNYGEDINARTGAMMEVNSNQLYPMADAPALNIPEVMLTQFFSNEVGIVIGKVDTGTDANEFAAGKGDTHFFNFAFTFSPVASFTMPYSALGAGVIILPTGDEKAAKIKVFALDANGTPNTTGFDTVFEGNTTYDIDVRVRTDFLGLTGHQLIGAAYSTKDFRSLDQNLRIVLEDRSIQQKDGSWSLYYNFDQYLYEENKGSGRGFGIFGRFGASDGNPNPVHYFYSLGVGGKGVLGRSLDSFGIGYYYITVGHPTFTGSFAGRSFLRDEQGLEAYYTIGITPWMKLTPDIQVIKPAQKQMVTGGSVANVGTATVVGLRLQLIF